MPAHPFIYSEACKYLGLGAPTPNERHRVFGWRQSPTPSGHKPLVRMQAIEGSGVSCIIARNLRVASHRACGERKAGPPSSLEELTTPKVQLPTPNPNLCVTRENAACVGIQIEIVATRSCHNPYLER